MKVLMMLNDLSFKLFKQNGGFKMDKFSNLLIMALIINSLLVTAAFGAGSGAFRLGFGDAESLAKGGAFVGEADNAAAVYHNPAGMMQLDEGHHVSGGLAWLNLFVDHENSSGVETQMRQENIIIPHLYYVSNFGFDNFAFGVGMRSNNGASTDWAEDSFSKYVATRTDLENIDYLLTGAYQITEKFSFGIGVDFVDAKMSQNKLLNQQPGTDAMAQLKFQDYGLGYSLSTLYQINEEHQFGLQYRSKTDLEWKGKVHLTGLNDAGASPLATIFGGSTYVNDIQWDVTLPRNVVFGYSFNPKNKWRFNFDAEWTNWASIEREVLSFPGETDVTRLSALASSTSLDLDWNNSWSFSLGAEYAYDERLDLRFGYFFHETPVADVNFNTFLPDSDSHGINIGFGYDFTRSMNMDMSWSGVFYEDRDLAGNSVGSSSGANLNGTYNEYVNIVMMTFNYDFGGE